MGRNRDPGHVPRTLVSGKDEVHVGGGEPAGQWEVEAHVNKQVITGRLINLETGKETDRIRELEAVSKAAVTGADARTRLAQEECKKALQEQSRLLHRWLEASAQMEKEKERVELDSAKGMSEVATLRQRLHAAELEADRLTRVIEEYDAVGRLLFNHTTFS